MRCPRMRQKKGQKVQCKGLIEASVSVYSEGHCSCCSPSTTLDITYRCNECFQSTTMQTLPEWAPHTIEGVETLINNKLREYEG